MATRSRLQRQGGFTLLEILVALVLLGLLMAGLTQGVRSGIALWSAETRRIEQSAELDGAARAMRALLSGMLPTPELAAAGSPVPAALAGDADHLHFVGDLPAGVGGSRRADIAIELRHGRLVLLWRPHFGGASPSPSAPPIETELVRDVERVEFAYWRPADSGRPGVWLAAWQDTALPKLIRVRLAFPNRDTRHWPDLLASPLLWAPPSAVTDAAASSGG